MREEVAKLLCSKPAEVLRIDKAVKLMTEGDPEHSKLKSLNVLKMQNVNISEVPILTLIQELLWKN